MSTGSVHRQCPQAPHHNENAEAANAKESAMVGYEMSW